MVYDQAGARQREFGLALEPVQVSPALKEIMLRPLKEGRIKRAGGRGAVHFSDRTPGLDYFDIVTGKCITRTYNYWAAMRGEFVILWTAGPGIGAGYSCLPRLFSHDLLFVFSGLPYYLRKKSR